MTRAITLLAGCLALALAGCDDEKATADFTLPNGSMEPTISMNASFTADLVHDYRGHRSDIVVFIAPDGWLGPDAGTSTMTKRVIGIGGDTVACCDASGRLELNGKPLDEAYLKPGAECAGPLGEQLSDPPGGCRGWSTKVAPGRLFVMGDNREDSADSSYHLCNPTDQQRAASDMSTNGRKIAAKCLKAFVPESAVIAVVPA